MIYFPTRKEMVAALPKNMVIAELGVFKGNFAKVILNEMNPKKLYLVDLFVGYFMSGDQDGKIIEYAQLEDELIKVREFFKPFENVEVVQSSTTEFLKSVPYLDMVYIDADHSYNSVKSDLELSFLKVKKGGLITGHDYVKNTEAEKAVNDFCLENHLQISILTNENHPSFVIVK
jgi:hypothetical protein